VAAARLFARIVLPRLTAERRIAETVDNGLMDVPESAFCLDPIRPPRPAVVTHRRTGDLQRREAAAGPGLTQQRRVRVGARRLPVLFADQGRPRPRPGGTGSRNASASIIRWNTSVSSSTPLNPALPGPDAMT